MQYVPKEFVVWYEFRNKINSPLAPAALICIVLSLKMHHTLDSLMNKHTSSQIAFECSVANKITVQ